MRSRDLVMIVVSFLAMLAGSFLPGLAEPLAPFPRLCLIVLLYLGFLSVGTGSVQLQFGGSFVQFVFGVGTVGEAFLEGVVAVLGLCPEDVDVECGDGVFGGCGDGCFRFRPGRNVCGFRRYGFNR